MATWHIYMPRSRLDTSPGTPLPCRDHRDWRSHGGLTKEAGRRRLALLGNSGNTSAPYLHFHVMDAPSPLGADHNLPYVFDSFAYRGRFEDDSTPVLLKNPRPREDELPLTQSVVDFGASRGN